MKKYKSYKELSEAFKSGELDKNKYFLMLDKSGLENTLCWRHNPNLTDAENDKMQDKASDMWRQDPPIEELFEIASIPCEWC